MKPVCETCGNEKKEGSLRCPFCRSKYEQAAVSDFRGDLGRFQVINLEKGMPYVEQAMEKLENELEGARRQGAAVVTIIHGWGSSGKGGKIRTASRKLLEYKKEQRIIRGLIWGEKFSKKDGPTRVLLRRFPDLGRHESLGWGNRGIAIVEM